jgi:hypothetical protein
LTYPRYCEAVHSEPTLKRRVSPVRHSDLFVPDARISVRAKIEGIRFLLAAVRLQQIILKYRPDQPRVPAGNPRGGQWTTADDGLPSDQDDVDRPIQLAADITGFTRHGINQAITRGVSPSAILDAVRNPLQVLPQPNGTIRYVGSNAVVVLNPSGQVVTVWGR